MSDSATLETINWISVEQELPDAEMTVLVRYEADCDPVWVGYWDGERWFGAEGLVIKALVTHWAEMPGGPQ